MLKWTVNKPGPNMNTPANRTATSSSSTTSASMTIFVDREPPARRSLGATLQQTQTAARNHTKYNGRKSLGSATLTSRKMRLHSINNSNNNNNNKENCIMMSPLRANSIVRASPTTSSPAFAGGKSDAVFREIGNLTPIAGNGNASANTTPLLRKAYLPPSPSPQPATKNAPAAVTPSPSPTRPPMPLRSRNFAATLPTLDVEYSPACYVQPSTKSTAAKVTTTTAPQALSVHGITVPTDIFASARYFQDDNDLLLAPTKTQANPPALSTSKKPRTQAAELTPLAFQLSKLRFSQVSLQRCGLLADDCDAVGETVNRSSQSLDDTALEQMIDEILESTRKVRKVPAALPTKVELPVCPVTTTTTTTAQDDDSAANRTIITMTGSVEREVRTPDSTFDDAAAAAAQTSNVASSAEQCHLRRQRVVRRKHTAKATVKSRKATVRREQIEKLARMETPKVANSTDAIHTGNTGNSITTTTPPGGIDADDLQGSSTPSTIEQLLSQQNQLPDEQPDQINTRRCLRYPDSPDSMEDSMEKRQSVASSSASTTSSLSRCGSSSKTAAAVTIFGTLDLTVAVQGHQVHVHVLRCKELSRTNGGPINAYVKVALLTAAQLSDTRFQRTAVQRNSADPLFEHRFVFENGAAELAERVQLSVWHRDREYKRSEFLGCMSFPVQSLYANAIAGTYRLQSQSNLTHPTAAILLQTCMSATPATPETTSKHNNTHSTSPSSSSSSNSHTAISLSKKALHQRDADEHLYLRYLRLSSVAAAAAAGLHASAVGRTACTLSKRLTAGPNRGFGFTVVWTHPPRVEKVEAGLPAERAGVRPGDFLAFVGEHNVVTMPEVDVLNLIRAQGETLEIEVFRKGVTETAAMPSAIGQTAKRPLPRFEDDLLVQRGKMARVEFSEEVGNGIVV